MGSIPTSGTSCRARERATAYFDVSVATHAPLIFTTTGPTGIEPSILLSPDEVVKAAKDIAGIQDFAAEYEHALVHVREGADMGAALGITRTPTFFINGRKLEGGQDPRVIDAVIELEMSRPQ